MQKTMILAGAFLAVATAAHAESVGACAWSRTPAPVREAFLTAYRTSLQSAMPILAEHDPELRQIVGACAGGQVMPPIWAQGALGSEAIQVGAAAAIRGALGLDRSALEAIWDRAPSATHVCYRANAAPLFGMTEKTTCAAAKDALWFLDAVKVKPATSPELANQVIAYFNARAQAEWADALIAKLKADDHPKA